MTDSPAFSKVWRNYRRHAERRNISWNLSREDLWEVIRRACVYCGAFRPQVARKGRHVLAYTGCDRVDNARGYEVANVVACCATCNTMKLNHPTDVFLGHVRRIAAHTQKARPRGASRDEARAARDGIR